MPEKNVSGSDVVKGQTFVYDSTLIFFFITNIFLWLYLCRSILTLWYHFSYFDMTDGLIFRRCIKTLVKHRYFRSFSKKFYVSFPCFEKLKRTSLLCLPNSEIIMLLYLATQNNKMHILFSIPGKGKRISTLQTSWRGINSISISLFLLFENSSQFEL